MKYFTWDCGAKMDELVHVTNKDNRKYIIEPAAAGSIFR